MTSAEVFLTKQLFIEKNIVTYRSLSRALGINVNVAKNELAKYYASCTQDPAPSATYLIVGEDQLAPEDQDEDLSMDVDDSRHLNDDIDEEYTGGEDVPQTKFLLVTESEFEDAKSTFRRISAIHVYSLSPSLIRDPGLLCVPTESVRDIDGSKNGAEMALTIGRVISKEIQIKAGEKKKAMPVTPVSTVKNIPTASIGKVEATGKVKGKEAGHEAVKVQAPIISVKPEKLMPTGKLDFSKAKTKDMKKEEAIEARAEQKKRDLERSKSIVKSEPVVGKKPTKEPQRGVKRKSTGTRVSDTDDATSTSDVPRSQPRLRIRRGAILSDDEDVPRTVRRQPIVSAAPSEADLENERSLIAMMDIDDDQVSRVSGTRPPSSKEFGNDTDGHDGFDMTNDEDEDSPPIVKPIRKKKVKKVVPVGRNGIKKRRLVKSRVILDPQGYRVTEDYSSYESVEEDEEPESVAPKVPKGKKKTDAIGGGSDSNAGPSKNKPEPLKRKGTNLKLAGGSSKLQAKGSITNFFGPAKSK